MDEIKRHLKQLQDKKYQEFSAKLIPNISNVLGIRLPVLRQYAKELSKSNINIKDFLSIQDNEFMEYTMLQGLVISIQNFSEHDFFDYVKNFVPRINNWAVCDTFCSSIKFTKKVLPKMRNFLDFYLTSKEEYDIRFGVVMLLNYYVIDEYIDDTLQALVKIKTEDYYAQMAIAWALSICYIKYFEKTHMIVSKSKIDSKILNMTIRKVNESLRPTKDQKNLLKTLKV